MFSRLLFVTAALCLISQTALGEGAESRKDNRSGRTDSIALKPKSTIDSLLVLVSRIQVNEQGQVFIRGGQTSSIFYITDTPVSDPVAGIPPLSLHIGTPTAFSSDSTSLVPDSLSETADSGKFVLDQNCPNPFNPSTTISLTLPAQTSWKIAIFNLLGQVVKSFEGVAATGRVDIEWHAGDNPTGIYIYRAEAGGFTKTRKMLLLK